MSDTQPVKLLSSLVNADFQVIDPNAAPPAPPGSVVDTVSSSPAIPQLEADYTSMLSVGSPALLDQFLATCNQNTGGLPANLQQFATNYVDFLVSQGAVANNDAAINSAVTTVLNGFVTSLEASISITTGTEFQDIESTIFPNVSTYGLGNSQDPDQYLMANTMWGAFIANYNYQSNGAVSNTSSLAVGLFQALRTFTAVTATIMQGTTVNVNAAGGGTTVVTSSSTPSYEGTFAQYFPTLPVGGSEFVTALQNFAQSMITEYGYFSPSRQYTKWVSYVQSISNTVAPPTATLPTQNVKILNNIFFLIVEMITAIQNATAAQSERLTLYTSWERGYTDLLNQVHVFTGASQDKLRDFTGSNPFTDNPSLTTVQQTRQNEQGNFNAQLVQQITAYSNTVQEDSKSLQSNVNQGSDAFNNQSNSATAILQVLSTILSSIFR